MVHTRLTCIPLLFTLLFFVNSSAEKFPTILREHFKMDLPSTSEGLIFIYIKEGDRVKKGSRLFGNQTKELQLKVTLAQLQWKQAKANLDKALQPLSQNALAYETETFKQKKALHEAGGLSEDAFRIIQMEYNLKTGKSRKEDITIAELNVETKKVQMQLAREQLRKATFKAPLSGSVNKIYVQHNEWVKPGQKVVQLIGVTPLHAIINADESVASRLEVKKAIPVTVNSGNGKVETKGVITFISEEVDAASQTIRIRVEIENNNRAFKPGMRADVSIR